jgi:hypothetical protein
MLALRKWPMPWAAAISWALFSERTSPAREGRTDMATFDFDQVWKAVRALDPEQQQRLRNLLDILLARDEKVFSDEDEAELELLKEGILDYVPPAPMDQKSFEEWKPIAIEGKPLLETIIEERRG